ncbi:MAG: GntR family transcriptional regulator [Lautropia sp.]
MSNARAASPPSAVSAPIPYQLMEQVRHGIITGRYPPGSALREQMIEREYGASRGPIREALRLLQLADLVTHEPRRGFRVREYSPQLITQTYRLRALLERHGVESLAGRPLAPLVRKLRAVNTRMSELHAARDIAGYLETNGLFHRAILETADNEPLQRSLATLNETAQPIRYALLARQFDRSQAIVDHDLITRLIESGDLEVAAAAMERHVLRHMVAASQVFDKKL